MNLKGIIFTICILLIGLITNIKAELANCDFEDTVNLTGATKFENGSYLYENVLITPDLVAPYNYEEICDGQRIEVESHLRGCVCRGRNCIKFCCDDINDLISDNTRRCAPDNFTGNFNKYINVNYNNGTILHKYASEEFLVLRGVPCEGSYALGVEDEWDIFENGTLFLRYDKSLISKRDYCLQRNETQNGSWILNAMLCPIRNIPPLSNRINSIAMVISIPFIVLTIFVYLILPELRKLPGKCLLSYLSSLAVGSIIISMITLSGIVFSPIVCKTLGYIAYFALLASFFWLNVLSYITWRGIRSSSEQSKCFLMFSAYAWGVPLCLTFIIMIIQNSDISDAYKPGISNDNCWLKTDDWSAMIYFYSINLVIMGLDTVFFLMSAHIIFIIQREVKGISSAKTESEYQKNLKSAKKNFGLFIRLFFFMGILWIFEIISYISNQFEPDALKALYFITDLMNAITGIMIFICFVLKGKILKQLKTSKSVKFGYAESLIPSTWSIGIKCTPYKILLKL